MRILYIQPAEGFGGAERQGVVHIRRLLDLGHQVVPVVGPGRRITQALEQAGVRDYVFVPEFISESDRPLGFLEAMRLHLRAPRIWQQMQRLLERLIVQREIELVFASRSYGWIVGSSVPHRLRVPLIWRGGSRVTSGLETTGLRVLAATWPPDALICNCEAVQRDLEPVVRSPSYIIPNGVDTVRFDPALVRPRLREELGLGPEVPVVGLAVRPAPEKGFELLAEVVLRTASLIPALRVLVAGEFGWRAHYQKLFAEKGLGERVTFLGHLDDVETLYRSSDVVVLTSRQRSIEGSPNALVEAMSMRCPVVATNVGGLAETVEHGVEGFLVEHEDAAGFSHYLVELLRNADLRHRMGEAGRAAALRKYDDRAIAIRLSALFRDVAAQVAAADGRMVSVPR